MYRALIICNSRFPGSRGALSDLHGPKKDGFLLRDVLTDHTTGMFDKGEVRNLNEGESSEVASAVEEFFGVAEPDDTLLFYYSGHGRTRNQQLFLCAQDTNVDKPYSTAIQGGMLKEIVASSLAQVKILILDCCYSAMFKGGEIADEFGGTGRYVIAATSATERASDGELRGLPSPFTGALADALHSRAEDRDGDGLVDLDDVYSYLDTVSFASARPYRKFDGAGAVPIARRMIRKPGNSAWQDSPSGSRDQERLSVVDDAAVYALESAQPDLPYLDRTVSGASFSQSRVDSFRSQMRSDLLEKMPVKLRAAEFLRQAGLMRHDRLTYTGLLLFGENPTTYLPAAVVQCARFHGTTMTAPLETVDLHGSVPELIVRARDFVAALARTGDLPTAGGAYAEAAYRYPMIAVREIIANAVVHRDYSDQQTCVQIHAFDDRIEIISPGKWGDAPITESGERPIGQLERRSQKRNFRLAQTLTWSKLVEGVGAGVPRSIADCESTGAPEPVVATDGRMVQVTIFPRRITHSADRDRRLVLARRLRALREEQWPGVKVNQAQLAAALSGDGRRNVSVPLISSWESRTNPTVPPSGRIRDIATFFATPRSFDRKVGRLLSPDEMTAQEQATGEELLQELTRLRNEALDTPGAVRPLTTGLSTIQEIARSLGDGPYRFREGEDITIVCAQLPQDMLQRMPYTDPLDPDFTELARYSDSDALLELFGHLRAANPTSRVQFRAPDQLSYDDYAGHLVSLGGVDWNAATRSVLDRLQLPVRQVSGRDKEGVGYFEITDEEGRKVTHRPLLDMTNGLTVLREDVALFARAVSPFNRKRFVTICNGMYGRGTYGGVRALTDERFRARNAKYVQEVFGDSEAFCILARVIVANGVTLTPDWTLPNTMLFEWSRSQ